MTLLDDVKAMMGPISVHCYLCTGSEISGHFDGCPIETTMPKIVAALEAAERFVDLVATNEPRWKAVTEYDLRLKALVAALRGEEVVPSHLLTSRDH